MSTETLAHQRNAAKSKEDVDLSDLEQRKQRIIQSVQQYAQKAFDELGGISVYEKNELLESVQRIELNKDKIEFWEEGMKGWMPKQQAAIKELFHGDLMDQLLEAYSATPRAISYQSIGEWVKRFRNPKVTFAERKKFISETLPAWVKNWKKVAIQRNKLLQNDQCKKLTKSDVPDIDVFLDENAFLNLPYPKRQAVTDQVSAALSGTNVKELFAEARNRLQPLEGKSIQSAYRWLHRIFSEWNLSPTQIKKFINNDLDRLIHNWKEVRADFDELSIELKMANVAPSVFRPISPSAFLALHFTQREAYVEQMRLALDKMDGTPGGMLSEIDARLHAKDWQGALDIIEDCEARTSGDSQLQKRRALVEFHLPPMAGKSEKSPGELQREIWDLMDQAPEPYRIILEEAALKQNADTFERMLQILFNRCWCWGRSFLDEDIEREQSQSQYNKEQTEHYLEHGHTRSREINILKDTTAEQGAIRDEKCNKAEVLYVDATDSAARKAVTEQAHRHCSEKNSGFGYWKTYIPTLNGEVVDYSKHHYTVFNINYKLKRSFRQLQQTGYHYRSRSQRYSESIN